MTEGTASTNFRYCGEYYDSETGNYYLRARYYDPVNGRFTTEDPIRDGLNWYSYCASNPVMYVDRNGLAIESIFDLASLGISTVEVILNPADIWAWAGLAGDIVDLIPFVTGVGEGVKAVRVLRTADKAKDVKASIKISREVLEASSEKTTKEIVESSVEKWGRNPSSRVLRYNMKKVGKTVPDYRNAAHHIVAGSDSNKYADEARKILEKFKIDINHSANGVFLPITKNVSTDAIYHPKLHTDIYYKNVAELLRNAKTDKQALNVLKGISEELLKGTFPY